MIDYKHLSPDELVSAIRKFGTENERLIVDKLRPELPDDDDSRWDDCPYCDEYAKQIAEAVDILS